MNSLGDLLSGAQVQTPPPEVKEPTREEKVIRAYENASKIKSASAQKAFLEKFIPRMEEELGLVGFISDEIKEVIHANPAEGSNLTSMMRNAQRQMKANETGSKAFNPTVPDSPPQPTTYTPDSGPNPRIMKAVKIIRKRVKNLDKLKGDSLDIVTAILSDHFSDEEIDQVLILLGVK